MTFICLYVCVHADMWKAEDRLWGRFSSSAMRGLGMKLRRQVWQQCLYPLTYLSGLNFVFYNTASSLILL